VISRFDMSPALTCDGAAASRKSAGPACAYGNAGDFGGLPYLPVHDRSSTTLASNDARDRPKRFQPVHNVVSIGTLHARSD
jgi:hypothetical protein